MSSISSAFARTSSLMMSQQLLTQLRQTQLGLLEAQKQLATGKLVTRPSDEPARASSILYLRGALAAREQTERNLQNALTHLNTIDAAVGDANDILLEAHTLALSQIGVGSDAETRKTNALVVDAQIAALLDIANRELNGLPLFAGTSGNLGREVFEEFLGGIRYNGSRTSLTADVGRNGTQVFSSNGVDVFGALSTRVKGSVDLDPQAAATTRIADVRGATLAGVNKGPVNVSVNGAVVAVDLTTADTLGDVVTRVNAAIDSVSPGAGSLAIVGESFALTGNGGNTVTITDIGSGVTAEHLGLSLSSTGGVADVGGAVNVKLTEQTRLADLGAGLDLASGMVITQGETSKTADFSAATTIRDMQNVIERLNLGVRLEINDAGTGLDLVSEVSGLALSIGENGGTTATDLGIRTYSGATALADFRDGLGIEPVEGEDDFEVQLHDGTTFSVDASALTTVDDLIAAIEAAAAGAGLTVGVDFDVALAATGNGLLFTDNTAGANDFVVRDAGTSLVATQLGINQNAGAANTMTSTDASKVRVHNLFTDLMDLRAALENNDERGITLAGGRIEEDLKSLTRARAIVGVEARRVQDDQDRSADMKIAEQAMLSEIQDADLTEVITRFGQLQTQLQASLQTGGATLQMSLLDFLR